MEEKKHTEPTPYKKLLIMGVLSFISMYVLMYAMVNTFSNVILNTNQFYMAGLMAMPMVIIEILIMRSMYMNKKINTAVIGLSVLALVGFYMGIRQQTAISDKQFLKSMIPHHAGAILMCEEATLEDPEVRKLCDEIILSQREEIRIMKSKLQAIKERQE